MKEFLDKILRNRKPYTDILIIAALLSVLLVLIGTLLTSIINALIPLKRVFDFFTGDAAVSDFALEYFSFAGIWVVIILTVFIFKKNRKMGNALRYNGEGNSGKGLLIGLLLGFSTNALCVLFSFLMGDIKLSFYGFDIRALLVFIIAVFIQSGAEELSDRFYLYQKLRRRYRSPLVAILGNSFIFAAMHAMNPGFTLIAALQIFTVAVIFSMLVYYYDALWAAMAFHAAWNFTQNIIFGLPNSGIVSAYSIFTLEAASARNGFFYNVNFGVEGSIGSTLILVIIAIAIYLINRGKPEKNDIWKEEPEQESQS
ncbi:MAG: CPBP family intramembrane metalloprotease [Erysipelotrichaceae bacterium]|nr:CPBP family intramembrane metalloprotease [Erysipelotrichaceae bacterium]